MMTLLELFNLYRDPVHQGWTRRGISFGTTVTCGRGWAIPDTVQGDESVAAVALFRGQGGFDDIDYDYCVGLAFGKTTSVSEASFISRVSGKWYCYDVRALNGAGVIGDSGDNPVRLHTNGGGAIQQIPNPPAWLSAVSRPGGKALVAVGYSPDGQSVSPTDLQAFAKELTDPYDTSDLSGLYDTPLVDDLTGLSEITCLAGQYRYTFNAGTQSSGVYVFGAKFRDAAGDGDGNNVISGVIEIGDALPPFDVDFSVS